MEKIKEIKARYGSSLILEGKSQNTIKNYLNTLENFLFYVKKNPDEITEKDVEAYLLQLKENRGLGNRSLARHSYALRNFYRKLGMFGLANNIPIPSYESKPPEFLKKDDLKKLFVNARDLREKVILHLGYDCALRVGELAKIKVDDIDPREWTILIHGRGGRERRVPIIENETKKFLLAYIEQLGKDTAYLFPGGKK